MLRAKLPHRGGTREIGVDPDTVFALEVADGSQRNFMVEIDRGTMPVRRSDPNQTSFEGKMRVYLAAHAAKQHERQLGWKNFRVLVVTTEQERIESMIEALRQLRTAKATLFLFATFEDLRSASALEHEWLDGRAKRVMLMI